MSATAPSHRAVRPRRLRRLLLVVLLVGVGTLAGSLVLAPHAHAAYLDVVPEPTRMEKLLAKRVEARTRALAAIDRKAAAWSRVLADRSARLSELGYLGDPEAATVVRPLASYRLSASFGAAGDLWERDHTGQDFGASSGTPLHAVTDAEVLSVGDAGAYGLRTVFGLPDGTQIWYCHQLTALVAPGETVDMAETVGLVGSTGNSTGPHLHLEVRDPAGVALDPAVWLAEHGLTI
jgi:murein DD-endopeptidase MepM/ murein hydrolase activator NlpD